MNASLVSIKQSSTTGTTYSVAWALQLNTRVRPAAKSVWQVWWSPKWNSADTANGYTNHVCQATFNADFTSVEANSIRNAIGDPQSLGVGKNAATVLTSLGTAITVAPTSVALNNIDGNTQAAVPVGDGWFTFLCQGFRTATDPTVGLAKFDVGSTVTFRSGFKMFKLDTSPNAVGSESAASTQDFTYVVVDSALALTVSAATMIAVSSLTF
jgi:hypothetical protein